MCYICKIIGQDWHHRDINLEEVDKLKVAFQEVADILGEKNLLDLPHDHSIGPFFVSVDNLDSPPEGDDPYILVGNDKGSKLQVDLNGNNVQVYWAKEQTSRTDICIARVTYDEKTGFVKTETFQQDHLAPRHNPLFFILKYQNEAWMESFLENGICSENMQAWIDDCNNFPNTTTPESLGFTSFEQMEQLREELAGRN